MTINSRTNPRTNLLTRNLRIFCWNTQSFQSKYHEIVDYLDSTHKDVICFSETWLKISDVVYLPSHKLYRTDRKNDNHGGVAIAIHKSIPHKQIHIKTNTIENVAVDINTPSGNITIISVYFPNSKLTSQSKNLFENDIKTLTSIRNSYFVCGDLNAKHRLWNNIRGNYPGNIIYDQLIQNPFSVHHSATPTYFPPQTDRNPSNIDIILTNNLHDMSQVLPNYNLMSDHCAIEFTIHCLISKNIEKTKKFRFDLTDWEKFQRKINEQINLNDVKLLNSNDIDSEITKFTENIFEAMNYSIPKRTHVTKHLRLTPHIRNLISSRNTIKRQYQRTRDPFKLSILKTLNKQIKFRIRKLRNDSFNSKLQTLPFASKPFWKIIKLIKNKTTNLPPLRKDLDTLIYTDSEKAQLIAETIYKSHILTQNYNHQPTINKVNRSISIINDSQPSINTITPFLTTPSEIRKLIKKLISKKAPGQDRIQNFILKKLPFGALVLITKLINACILHSYFPKDWKIAKIIAIQKQNKDPMDPSSYRPISLLSSLSKLFERVLLHRINRHIDNNNIIPNHQFGFRKAHSTTHQLYRVVKLIKTNLSKHKSTGMITLDIEKAYDTIWHNGLIHKLLKFKFPLPLIKIIKSFLSDRYFYVQIYSAKSELFQIPAGLPQGSSLSPILYNVYTSDLKTPKNTTLAQFADDTNIMTYHTRPKPIIDTLEKAYRNILNYYYKWKIKINDAKSDSIFFTRRRAKRFLPHRQLQLNNHKIDWSKSIKYLGIELDKTLTFSNQVQYTKLKTLKLIKTLYPFINRKSKLNHENKLLIFKSIFHPVLLYASPVWGNCANTHLHSLQTTQNKILRLILNKPFYYKTSKLHIKTKIKLLQDTISIRTQKFISKCIHSNNPLISNIPN